MRKLVLILAVVCSCVGCSGPGGQEASSPVPDYDIVKEQQDDASDLEVREFEIATASTKAKQLRRIAEEIKVDNADQDALDIEFYPKKHEQGGSADLTGAAMVMNNEEAVEQVHNRINKELGLPPLTDEETGKLLNKNNGITVVPFAEIEKDMEREMENYRAESEKDMQQMEKDMEKDFDKDMRELEKDMKKEMPKMP